MLHYLTKRVLCFLLAVAITVSLSVSFFGVVSVYFVRSTDYLTQSLATHRQELKTDLDSEIARRMPQSKFPSEAYTASLDNTAINYIITTTANNIAVQNANDFSLSEPLYNTLYKNLLRYADENGVNIKAQQVSRLASLEVDVISGFLAQADTENVALYRVCRDKTALILIAAAVVVAIMSYALIHIINDGRHRKNSYIGMAFVSAGYIEIIGTVAARLIHASEKESYCGYKVFDAAIGSVANQIMGAQIPIGIVLLMTGLFVLITNYYYFWKKNARVNEQRRQNTDMRNEYMQHYRSVKGETKTITPGERETMDIDF